MYLYEATVLKLSNNQNIFKLFNGAVTEQLYLLVLSGNFFSLSFLFRIYLTFYKNCT